MKIMIDTNIVISAALFPNGRVAAAFRKALLPPYKPLICDYVVNELHEKFSTKFADRQLELEAFLYTAMRDMEVISTPIDEADTEYLIRDVKDRPILRAALDAHADLLLTGDNDFLEASVTDPRIISAASFLDSDEFIIKPIPPKPTAVGGMPRTELDAELQKGIDSLTESLTGILPQTITLEEAKEEKARKLKE